jgi:hypothetical protein
MTVQEFVTLTKIYRYLLKNAKVSPIFKSEEKWKNISQDICISTWQNTIFYMMPNLVLDQIIPVKLL